MDLGKVPSILHYHMLFQQESQVKKDIQPTHQGCLGIQEPHPFHLARSHYSQLLPIQTFKASKPWASTDHSDAVTEIDKSLGNPHTHTFGPDFHLGRKLNIISLSLFLHSLVRHSNHLSRNLWYVSLLFLKQIDPAIISQELFPPPKTKYEHRSWVSK